jgi:acylphosphatase
MSNKAIHAWVSGQVQGVFYRKATCEVAERLEIKGWVKNLPDGRVELAAYGPAHAIETLIRWLHRGPPHAHVTDVEVKDIPWENYESFSVLK